MQRCTYIIYICLFSKRFVFKSWGKNTVFNPPPQICPKVGVHKMVKIQYSPTPSQIYSPKVGVHKACE